MDGLHPEIGFSGGAQSAISGQRSAKNMKKHNIKLSAEG
jgi:hypothetical protein